MAKTLPKINTSSLDELFTTEEQRQEAKLEKVMKIPIDEIKDFKKHPFNVRMDSEMESLIESVSENGILVPVLVRPNEKKDGYEMVSGHRRKFAIRLILSRYFDPSVQIPTLEEQQNAVYENIKNMQNGIYFSQEEIDRILQRGSNIEQGKYRIYQEFLKNNSIKDKAKFLKEEYGTGGSYPAVGFIDHLCNALHK